MDLRPASVLALIVGCAAFADVVHDESVDGDLSGDPDAPTPLVFSLGGNTVIGSVVSSSQPMGDRDYWTFTIPAGQRLDALHLVSYAPDDLAFAAFNAGATSFIPTPDTDANFLAGVLIDDTNAGVDILPLFQTDAVTQNSLDAPFLDAGEYSFVIQQTSGQQTFYTLEFVVGLAPTTRQVQISSIDFDAGVIELFNFSSADFDLTGWRFCSHDFDQERRYSGSAGLNGVMIEAGTSVFIHFNNDAPAGDPDRLNRSSLGGAFATPLDQDAYGLQLFFPDSNGVVTFGNSTLIADHLQWNIDGQGAGQAEERTAQAVSEGLWSAVGDFIPTRADSVRIDLLDRSGDTSGSPAEYAVTDPCLPDLTGEGDVNTNDFFLFLSLYQAMDPRADFSPGGGINTNDFFAFLAAYQAGC